MVPTPRSAPLLPRPLLASPRPPSPLWLEDTPALADMSPTVPEWSMLPRGLLMPSPRLRLMLSMELMDMVFPTPMVPTMDMLDSNILVTPTPMALTTDMLDTLTPPMLPPRCEDC